MLHIDIPSRDEILRLLDAREAGSVSIYIPTSPITTEADAGRIELKNQVSEAVSRLEATGLDRRSLAAIGDSLADLDDDVDFWAHQARSLAVFATPTRLQTFRLPNRLSAVTAVSDRFHLKPLLRAVTFPQAAFVLALAQGSVRLLEVAAEVPPVTLRVEDLPSDVASSAGKSSIKDRSESGRLQGAEGQKVRMAQYARHIDAAIRPILTGHDLPLILAATEPLESIYRSVNSYPHLVDEVIGGNPEGRSDADLAAAARPVLDAVNEAALGRLRDRFGQRSGEGRTSTDIVDVARAATFGAVDTVWIDIDTVVPGSIDEVTGAVTPEDAADAGAYGIVDEIARRTLTNGGRVLAVRRDHIPGAGDVAAILRFAV